MSDVAAGGPPAKTTKTRVKDQITPLVNEAMENPGEWFNIEVPETTTASLRSSLTYNVAKAVSEWAVRDGVLYFRFRAGD